MDAVFLDNIVGWNVHDCLLSRVHLLNERMFVKCLEVWTLFDSPVSIGCLNPLSRLFTVLLQLPGNQNMVTVVVWFTTSHGGISFCSLVVKYC